MYAEADVFKLKDTLNKLTTTEYNFPTYIQTTYNDHFVNMYCGFKAWANTEIELMKIMQSGDRSAIINLVNNRVGAKFKCPFRLHYLKTENKAGDST